MPSSFCPYPACKRVLFFLKLHLLTFIRSPLIFVRICCNVSIHFIPTLHDFVMCDQLSGFFTIWRVWSHLVYHYMKYFTPLFVPFWIFRGSFFLLQKYSNPRTIEKMQCASEKWEDNMDGWILKIYCTMQSHMHCAGHSYFLNALYCKGLEGFMSDW